MDRILLWLSLVASTIPLGAGLVLIGADRQLMWLVVAAGTLVTGQLVLYNWTLGRLIRLLRVRDRLRSVYRVCVTLGIAASPVGHWLAERWQSVAVLTGVTGAIILPGTLVVIVRLTAKSEFAPAPVALACRLMRTLCNTVLRFGLFPYFLAGLFWPDRALLVPVVALAATEAATYGYNLVFNMGFIAGHVNADALASLPPEARVQRLREWLQDSFLAHPERPDYLLVHGLCGEVMNNLLGPSQGTGSRHLLDVADEALCLVESALMPRYPLAHLPILQSSHARARAHWATNQGNVYKFLTQYEEALTSWRDAIETAEGILALNHAGMIRAGAAATLAGDMGRPEAALAELGTVLTDEMLFPHVRRWAMCAAALAAKLQGEDAEADRLWREARRLAINNRQIGATLREVESLTGRRPSRAVIRGIRKTIMATEEKLAVIMGAPDAHVPSATFLESRAGKLAFRGYALLLAGRPKKAAALLTRATKLAVTARDLIWIFRAQRDLGRIYLLDFGDPIAGYQHLEKAISTLEDIRAFTLDPDLRIGVAGQGEEVYELAAVALVTASKRTWRPAARPVRPLQAAFEITERMRSRVFLELLGETALATPPGAAAGLGVMERAVSDRLAALYRDDGQAWHGETLERRRAAREQLEAIWAEIAETGPRGAEYAHLRQGRPNSFDEIRELLTFDYG